MQKRMVAMLLALVMVVTLLPLSVWAEESSELGSVANPADLTIGENSTTLIAGDTDGYTFAYTAEEDGVLTVMMPEGKKWKYSIHNVTTDETFGPYTFNDETVVDIGVMELSAGDVAHVNITTYNPGNPTVAIAGKLTFTATFPEPLGDWLNPAPLKTGINTAEIPEGSYGYYYTWTAEEEGNLVVTLPEINEESTIPGWYYSISNITQDNYGDFYYSDSASNRVTVAVAAGDEIELIVCTYDPADGLVAPAGSLAVEAMFSYPQGSAKSPIFLSADAVVTIPAGTSVYYTGRFGGQFMTAVGAGVTLEHNGETYVLTNEDTTFACFQQDMNNPSLFVLTNTTDAPVEVSLTITVPSGTLNNPEELVMGENVAQIEEGNDQGYYFTWTAEADGVLTLTMPEGNWQYVIHNLSAGTYGSNHISNDDPVANPAQVEVSKGEELQIVVNGFDPADANHYPAVTLKIQASFQGNEDPGVHTHEYVYTNNEDGNHTVACACGDSYTEPHNFNNGICICGAVEAGNDTITGSQSVSGAYNDYVAIQYTPATNGVLTLDLTSTVGHKVQLYLDNGNGVGLPNTVNSSKPTTASYSYNVQAATNYTINIWGYKNWGEDAATITYTVSFQASSGEVEQEKEKYQVDSENPLQLGDNERTLLTTALTTLYVFTPQEMGVYTFTAPEGVILGVWGNTNAYLVDPGSTSNTCQWTCTQVGQKVFIGASGAEGAFIVNVAKTGTYEPTIYTEVEYVNKAELSAFHVPACATLGSYVDVTGEHTAVLGADGYYHLDAADGPILLMDLNYQDIILSAKLKSEIPTMYLYTDERLDDGSYIKYDIRYAIAKNDKDGKLSYEEVMDAEGYYPLTEDLILFYKDYATAQGVWSFYLPGVAYNSDSVWMYCCRTMTLNHSYSYQDNGIHGNNTHTAACICGDYFVEEHTYENGACTFCGAEQPAADLIKWVGTQLQATSNLDMQFALRVSDLGGTTGNYIVLTRTYADGTTDVVEIPQTDWTVSDNFYIVAYSGIAAKEMNDVVSAVVYNANGEVISETRSESIVTYALSMLGKITNEEQKTMFVDLLNYGAEAQKFFHYNESNLANAGLTEAQKAWGTQEDIEVADHRVKGTNFFGSNLSLENVILLQMAFKVTPVEGMYAVVTYTDHNGKAVNEKLAVINNSGYTMVSINSLAIADYRVLVNCTVYDADGNVVGSATDSMESYVARSNTDLGKAIMRFGASAYAYFH